jgi:outer membrane murein-binding lipoprotein Lpp
LCFDLQKMEVRIVAPITLSFIVFACIADGALLGVFLRNRLPEHHLSGDTKDVVRLSTGLVGTMAALVLGLLIASANSSYDTQSTQINQLTAKVILLDNILAQYGEETKAARQQMRRAVATLADRIWHENVPGTAKQASFSASAAAEEAYARILQLSPHDDIQRSLKDRAIQVYTDIAQTRLLLFAQASNSVPMPFLVVLTFWLTFIFASFSLFAQLKPVVWASLLVSAVSAASAIFLILELSQPFLGLMQISSEPLREALSPLV